MGIWAWWQQKKGERVLNKLARMYFTFWWNKYKDVDCPEREALTIYMIVQSRKVENRNEKAKKSSTKNEGGVVHQMAVGLANLLWERGYRHGDHVLVYEPFDGSFREKVVTKFYDEPSLMPPDIAAKFEEAQGTHVKSVDRTQRKSQPEFTSHETGWLLPRKLPRSFP